MNNKMTIAALCAAGLLALVSCKEKDYTAYPPTWKGFQIERNGVKVSNRDRFEGGDSVRFTAVQDQKGRYINSTYYNWTLKCQVYSADGTSYKDSILTKQCRPLPYLCPSGGSAGQSHRDLQGHLQL